jgi:hypothetical protein
MADKDVLEEMHEAIMEAQGAARMRLEDRGFEERDIWQMMAEYHEREASACRTFQHESP